MDYEKLSGDRLGETSESIRMRVQAARDVQSRRFVDVPDIICNADMRVGEIRKFCKLQDEGGVLSRVEVSEFDAGGDMVLCMTQHKLSARAYHRILKLARTIADLGGSQAIQYPHLAEALQYRPKLMMI